MRQGVLRAARAGALCPIRTVAMDVHSSFIPEVQAHCPNAEIVFDLFHVVAKYRREVIDRVRVDEASRLKRDKPAREVIKSSRWLLLRSRENLTRREDRVRLSSCSTPTARSPRSTRCATSSNTFGPTARPAGLTAAGPTGIAVPFAAASSPRRVRQGPRRLRARHRRPGALATPHPSLLEGINNKIKVIKRMACRLRDDEYLHSLLTCHGVGPKHPTPGCTRPASLTRESNDRGAMQLRQSPTATPDLYFVAVPGDGEPRLWLGDDHQPADTGEAARPRCSLST